MGRGLRGCGGRVLMRKSMGMHSKTISHALLDEGSSAYPRVKIARGNMLTSMGHTVRGRSARAVAGAAPAPAPAESHVELLPEEALYLLERGSMQAWVRSTGHSRARRRSGGGAARDAAGASPQEERRVQGPITASNADADADAWDESIQGFPGAVEMSVMQGFAHFIGRDGLTLERYQVGRLSFEATYVER